MSTILDDNTFIIQNYGSSLSDGIVLESENYPYYYVGYDEDGRVILMENVLENWIPISTSNSKGLQKCAIGQELLKCVECSEGV